jgi:integrase
MRASPARSESTPNEEFGVNAKALSSYMGHSSITITLDRYGHLMPGNEDAAAELLDAYLERANTAARLVQVTTL